MAKMSSPSQNTVCVGAGKTNILIVNLYGNEIGMHNPQKNRQTEVFCKNNLDKKRLPNAKTLIMFT